MAALPRTVSATALSVTALGSLLVLSAAPAQEQSEQQLQKSSGQISSAQCTVEIDRLTQFNSRLQTQLEKFFKEAEEELAGEQSRGELCSQELATLKRLGSGEELRAEISRLRTEAARLRQQLEQANQRAIEVVIKSVPCAAVKVDARSGEPSRIRAIVTSESEATDIRRRIDDGQSATPEVEVLRLGTSLCLTAVGNFVLAREKGGPNTEMKPERPEVVFEPKTSSTFQTLERLLIAFDRCAEVASDLRSSGALGRFGDEDLAIWALRGQRLVLCKEDRGAPLESMWTVAAGRQEGRAGLLVLRFGTQVQ